MRALLEIHERLIAVVLQDDETGVIRLVNRLLALHPRESELQAVERQLNAFEAGFLRETLQDW